MIRARDVDVGSRPAGGGIARNVDPGYVADVQRLGVVATHPVDLNDVALTLQIVYDAAGRSVRHGVGDATGATATAAAAISNGAKCLGLRIIGPLQTAEACCSRYPVSNMETANLHGLVARISNAAG
jgi:hypothetical protein